MSSINMKKLFVYLFLVFTLWACTKQSVFYQADKAIEEVVDADLIQSVFLLGDVGEGPEESKYPLRYLHQQLQSLDHQKAAVVFLGDNIYPVGLHEPNHPMRKQDEERIIAQLDAVKDFKGELAFIPGNHDWRQGKEDGFEAVKLQEDFIQDYLNAKVFEPSDGCSGPDEMEVSDELTIILIDTQWWLHKHRKGRGEKDDCKFSTKEQFLLEFKELLKKNRHRHVIVAGHHPLYSNGRHGGYFTLKNHLFPLADLKKGLYIPLPILGSIYPFYRSFFGNIQDIAHPEYQELKRELLAAINTYDNVIYAAGHEHNLQYVQEKNGHFIVSGAGSKATDVRFNKKVDFAAKRKGLSRIDVYQDGSVYLSFIVADEESKEGEVVFRKKLYQKHLKSFQSSNHVKKKSYASRSITVVPDSAFHASAKKQFFFGKLHRKLWTLPIEVPYLDIHYINGGLTPVEKGGGQQTVGLKFETEDGIEFKFRKIKKSADFLVEKQLRGTLAQDIIYDGIGGSHPYAAVSMPKMSEAANIYYTKPQLVYLPKDSILGDYYEEFGGSFGLFEMHPDDDMSEYPQFGNSAEVLNYQDAIEELSQHQDHVVDEKWVLRSRLFDLFIGDWDRHDDQWRWATFEKEDKTIYRPIPRDRDQAFFQFDGVIMKIANRKWLLRKFQHFKNNIRDIAGLSFNARYFDRYFLTSIEKEDWVKQALFLKNQLSDSVLEASLKDLPNEAYELNGEKILKTLINRREKLEEFALEYYEILAKEVNVYGTIKKDFVEIIRNENGSVEVNLYPRKKGKRVEEEQFYHRVFWPNETKEIRIYGMGGKDEYELKGESKSSILVRIIASREEDKLKDDSKVAGCRKYTKYYDDKGNNDLEIGKETQLKLKKEANAYFLDRREFRYDNLAPLPSIGFNLDDGFYIGAGFQYTGQGFKKDPYAMKHRFTANYARRAEGFKIEYENDYRELLGSFDAGLKVSIKNPEVYQFYGFGNETKAEEAIINQSDVRLNRYAFRGRISKWSRLKASRISLLFGYENIFLTHARFVDLSAERKTDNLLSVGLAYQYKNTDSEINPAKGIEFNLEGIQTNGMNYNEVNFFKLNTHFSLFIPLNMFKKQTTLASRLGYANNFGDYRFYQANFLSGMQQMRGLSRNRFAGESVVFGNLEFRKSFLKVKNYIMPFDFGMLLHTDIGRVYVENDSSKKWHNAIGGGFFFNILDYFALVASYAVSDEDQVVNFGTNFYF